MIEFEEQQLLNYTDEELLVHISKSPPVSPSNPRVRLISTNIVAKGIATFEAPDEIATLQFAKEIGIRVPKIERIIPNEYGVYIIMYRVQGTMLEEIWDHIGWFKTIRFAFQLRYFIRAMRKNTSPTAGGLISGKCHSIWLDDHFGLPLHASPEILNSYITFWLQYSWEQRRTYPNIEGYRMYHHLIPPVPKSLTFTHQDLAPRNILVDKKNNIWLLDWQFSGWYPEYFEYVGMQNWNFEARSLMSRLRWWVFCLISVGIYARENEALQLVRGRSLRDGFARCVVPGIEWE